MATSAQEILERLFQLQRQGTTVGRELLGGATTFTTLSYILFVQPAVMAAMGMEPGAVLTATCLASAFATLLMGLLANYPLAVAPAMGHNFYIALVVCGPIAAGGMGYSWPVALGANFIAATAFLILTLTGVRQRLLDAIPPNLVHAIAAGIGLLITLIGCQWAGLVKPSPGTMITLGDLGQLPVQVAIAGTLLTAMLLVRGNRAAILLGTLGTAAACVGLGLIPFHGVIAAPASLLPTFGGLDIAGALRPDMIAVIFVLFFLGLFDTIGTLVGVCSHAGLLEDGKLVRAREAMASDALGTMVGTVLGTTTVTAYVESAAGVQAGARTGLASVTTAVLLLASLFLSPLVRTAGTAVALGGATLYPVVAPALIAVGSFMVRAVRHIDFDDPPAALAAFITLVVMPFSFSITEGIAFGFISHAVLMLACGRGREVDPLLYGISALLLARYVCL